MLLNLGISSHRIQKHPGVWVDNDEICSIGLHITRQITMHGFALNVRTNLKHFEYINPCGVKGKAMTSISKLLGRNTEVEDIIKSLPCSFSKVFGHRLRFEDEVDKSRLF